MNQGTGRADRFVTGFKDRSDVGWCEQTRDKTVERRPSVPGTRRALPSVTLGYAGPFGSDAKSDTSR